MVALAGRRKSRNPIVVEDSIAGWVFLTPALIIFIVFIFGPIIYAFWMSLNDWNIAQVHHYIGLANYRSIFSGNEDFNIALRNTVWYTVGVVPVQTFIGLVLAVLANRKIRGRAFFRTAFYFPSISSSVVISLIFLWIYAENGLLNLTLRAIGLPTPSPPWMSNPNGVISLILSHLGVNNVSPWLAGPSFALLAIMMLNVWTTAGTMMLIFLAGLQDVPGDVYEAAALDGATRYRMFRDITVPLIKPVTLFVVTLGMIGSFQVFDQIFVMSSGGPAKTTTTMAWLIYVYGFQTPDGRGLAAAFAVILFLIILFFFLIQRRIAGKSEYF